MASVIVVKDLVKKYGDLIALNRVSFSVGKGEIFGYIGPNGAGKTTTIDILLGLHKPTSGTVVVLGYKISEGEGIDEIKRKVGVLPQDFAALDRLTVKENVELFCSMYDKGLNPDELISLVRLEEHRNIRFKDLSGGLKQRVGIAAALAGDPELVFLDEPTSGLDPRARRETWDIIKMLKELGKTVFLTTHYMEEAEFLSDRIAIINKGKIVAIGSPSELILKYGGSYYLIVRDCDSCAEILKARKLNVLIEKDKVVVKGSLKDISAAINVLAEHDLLKNFDLVKPTIENVFLRLLGARITEEGELA